MSPKERQITDRRETIETNQKHYCNPYKTHACSMRRCLFYVIGTVFFFSLMLTSCEKKDISFSVEEHRMADSIVRSVNSIDSLKLLQKQMEGSGNNIGNIIALRELGKALRNESRFEEALDVHSKGLRLAEAAGDTLEIVQAMNNIGTDYRRIGALDVAQEYHYNAWKISEGCADSSFTAKKNRAVSLNGLGNIYLETGNYERADSTLRMALNEERGLKSAIGQAINYANLGAIFKQRGERDSAWVYYKKSMAFNLEADSKLGISLCHTYFGSLYEEAGEYDKAMREYTVAYEMMQTSKDEWHALTSLIALAGISNSTDNDAKAIEYLEKAKKMAEAIKSPEHLSDIYTLYYKFYKKAGNSYAALEAYEKAMTFQDKVRDMEKINRIQNTSLKIERTRQTRLMDEAKLKIEHERSMRYIGFSVLGLVLFILAGLIALMWYSDRLRRRNHLALKKMSELRENFFTNITHEFRTPLTVILGLSHELQKCTECPKEVGEKVQMIERQGKGLLALINQLLDISKIKSSVGSPDWHNGNIVAYINMIVESYQDFAQSRSIVLQFMTKGEIIMDFVPDYVSKVMNNLLSNAFKFTPENGKVVVKIWRIEDTLRIDVTDTGVGMDKETVSHIFEPFYQGERNVGHVGTGVGLALVKQIVNAVEGKITVDSERGKGTTFSISVPIRNESKLHVVAEANNNVPILTEMTAAPTDTAGDDNDCRLLIIEDNGDIAAYIGSQLSDSYAVAYASNGSEGLEKAVELVPDLIITDLMMPGMDGLEVCRQVRGNEIISHIPIIVVTAKCTDEERIKGIEAGADAYLAKPFNSEELRVRVEKLLDGRRLLQEKYMRKIKEDKVEEENNDRMLSDSDMAFLANVTNAVYMELNNNTDVNVSLIAANVCMSNSQFYRKMVALTGCRPIGYIQSIKIKKAKSLLNADLQISFSEVAEKCGFGEYSTFVRAFKNECGITPSEYRRRGAVS
jgi:two-component system sensor histidine kinase ChiS